MNRCRNRIGTRGLALALVVGGWLTAATSAEAQLIVQPARASKQTVTPDIQQLINQFVGSGSGTTFQQPTQGTTTPTTPTTPTPPTTPGGEGARQPLTTSLNNVTLGGLQNRAPGSQIQQAIAIHTGTQTIPGDADSFTQPNWIRQTAFSIFQSALQAIQQGITQLLGRSLTGLFPGLGGVFGPGQVNVGDPLQNQTTLPSGTVIQLP